MTTATFVAEILAHVQACEDPDCCARPLVPTAAAFGKRHLLRLEDGELLTCLCTTGCDHDERGFDKPHPKDCTCDEWCRAPYPNLIQADGPAPF